MAADQGHGDAAQGLPWLATSVVLYEELGDRPGRVQALSSLGAWTRVHGQYTEGTALLRRALTLARELADSWLIGVVLALSAHSADLQRAEERQGARQAAEEGIRLLRQAGDTLIAAGLHWPLGLTALYARDDAAARHAFAIFRDDARALRDTTGVAFALTMLGDVARVEGELPAAAPFYQESLALWRELGVYTAPLAHALGGLGDVALAAGDKARAHACFVESLTTAQAAGALGQIARALEGLGRLAAAQGRPDRAARLGGAAETVREQAGPARPRDLEAHLVYLLPPDRVPLGAERHRTAWAAGQVMTLEQAIALALKGATTA